MGMMEWNPTLETNHPLIDEQHQSLLAAFNRLYAAVEKGQGSGEVRKTLMFLTNYTLLHLKTEEELMDNEHYPDAERHKKLHHDLVVKLSELVKCLAERSTKLTTMTMEFLEGWLVEHIQGEDSHLAEFLRSKDYQTPTME